MPNVDRMLRRLTARQFLEWEYYAQLEPFGEIRADYRAASIASTIANVHRSKGQNEYTLEDFRLKYDDEPRKGQTWQEKMAAIKALASMYKASDKAV